MTSIRYRRVTTANERLAWMIILATIPVGIAGLALEHLFRVFFSKPVPTALFLCVNGLILLASERRQRSRTAVAGEDATAAPQQYGQPQYQQAPQQAPQQYGQPHYQQAPQQQAPQQPPWHGQPQQQQGDRDVSADKAVAADRRLSAMGFPRAILIGATQIAALLPGISRDGIVTVTSMRTGLSRQDAVRYSFLLSTPVILAAGVLKIPDLFGPLGAGIGGQVLAGSVLAFIGAFLSVRFLTKYFGESKSLRPFGIYCVAAGLFSLFFILAFR
jgi:undecaprenyl-diphosphatase